MAKGSTTTGGVTVRVIGAERLDRTLEQAADQIGDMATAVDRANQLVAQEARRRAPRRSGRLAASIEVGKERNRAIIGSSVVYAPPIHWGWRTRGISPDRFVLDAATETEQVWLGFFSKDIQTALDKVKGA